MRYEQDSHLKKAEDHFYSWRLMDAYNILRRYYSRLPFQPEDNHGKYIGMFIRVLAELGKTRELNFYLPELERIYENRRSPAIAYQLGMVYVSLSPLKLNAAEKVFEALAKDQNAEDYAIKAKVMLAWIFDKRGADPASVRQMISSLPTPQDRDLALVVEIWRAKVLRDEGRLSDAELALNRILDQLELPRDWYAYTSAKIVLIWLYFQTERHSEAMAQLLNLRRICEGKHFRSIELQILDIEKHLEKNPGLEKLVLEQTKGMSRLKYQDQTWEITGKTTPEKILLLLVKNRFIDRNRIVKQVFRRKYRGEADDKLIYSYVHALRKQFARMGLPENAITRENGGYRLVPGVETIGERV